MGILCCLLQISGLSSSTSWQDLKDWARRQVGDSVVYGDVWVEKDHHRVGVIEFDNRNDYEHAVEHLDGQSLHGKVVTVYRVCFQIPKLFQNCE